MPYKDPEKRREYMRAYQRPDFKKKPLRDDMVEAYGRRFSPEALTHSRIQSAKYQQNRRKTARMAGGAKLDQMKASAKNSSLKRRFGITLDDYLEMLEKQHGVCAICCQPETKQFKGKTPSLAVDHNHLTGKVRELLCNRCNTTLGAVTERPDILHAMIRYLEKHNG